MTRTGSCSNSRKVGEWVYVRAHFSHLRLSTSNVATRLSVSLFAWWYSSTYLDHHWIARPIRDLKADNRQVSSGPRLIRTSYISVRPSISIL
jgi:hypothetical protein